VVGLLLLGIVGALLVLYAGERVLKARARVRRRRVMGVRLAAATARAEEQHEQREAAVQASAELTSFMPAIQRPPLTLPGVAAHGPAGPAGPATGCERAGQKDRRPAHPAHPAHPGRRPSRTGEHLTRSPDRAGAAE
jgi:hypothetical protein